MTGLAARAPPEGLTAVSSPRPRASVTISSWKLNGAWISATSIGPSASPGTLGRQRGGDRGGDVLADRGQVGLDAVIDAGDPRRTLAQVVGLLAPGQDHRGAAVGGGRQVVAAERVAHVVGGEELVDVEVTRHLRVLVVLGRRPVAGDQLGDVALGGLAGVEQGPVLQRGQRPRVGAERGQVVRIDLDRVERARVGVGVLPDAGGDGGVDVALQEAHERLVHGEGAVHLHVRLVDRRPGAVGVDVGHEREGLARQVVTGAETGEADVVLGETGALEGPLHGGEHHLGLGVLGAAQHRRLRVPDDGDVVLGAGHHIIRSM